MQIIFKKRLPFDGGNGNFRIELPKNCVVLTVQLQDGFPTIWYRFNPSEEEVVRKEFTVCGTGQQFEEANKQYIGTYQLNGFVWHLFIFKLQTEF